MMPLSHILPHPSLLAAPIRLLPDKVRYTPLAKLINHLFAEAIEDGEFDFLENRWVKLIISDARLEFSLSFDGEKLVTDNRPVCDVIFKGDSQSFVTLALRKEDPDTLFFQRKLMIEGDTELGLGLKNLLDSIDHEQLPAMARTFINVGQKVTETLNR